MHDSRILTYLILALWVHATYLFTDSVIKSCDSPDWLIQTLLLLPLWESVIVLCFVVRYFMSILVFQSSWWGRESWLLCLSCLPGVLWWLSGSSSRCHGVVCSLWLWYFLIILTYYFCYQSASSRVTESTSFTWPCGTWFQKCFSVEKLIIVSISTVIPIIVIV